MTNTSCLNPFCRRILVGKQLKFCCKKCASKYYKIQRDREKPPRTVSDAPLRYVTQGSIKIDMVALKDPDQRFYTVEGGGYYAYMDKGKRRKDDGQ